MAPIAPLSEKQLRGYQYPDPGASSGYNPEHSPAAEGNPLIKLFLESAPGVGGLVRNVDMVAPGLVNGALAGVDPNPLNALLQLLKVPGEVIAPATGPGLLGMRRIIDENAKTPPSGIPGFPNPIPNFDAFTKGISQAQDEYHREGLTGSQAKERAFDGASLAFQLAGGIATDPLSFLGMGVPGQLGKAVMPLLPKIGVTNPQAQLRVLGAFDYLNKLDKAAMEAPWKGTKAGFEKFTGLVGDVRIPESLGLKQYFADSSSVPARTIGEWAGSQSRQSFHKKFTGQIEELVKRLGPKGLGFDLEELLTRHQAYEGIPNVENAAEAMKILKTAKQSLTGLGTDDYSKAVLAGIERMGKALKDHAQVTMNHARVQGANPAEVAAIRANAIMDLYWDSMSLIVGGRRMITNPKTGADFAAATAPGLGKAQIDSWLADVLMEGRKVREGRIVKPIYETNPQTGAQKLLRWEVEKRGKFVGSAYLPDGELDQVANREYGNLIDGLTLLSKDKEELADILREAWKGGRGADPMPAGLTAGKLSQSAYDDVINPTLAGLGYGPVKNVKELMNALNGLLVASPQKTAKVKEILTRWTDGEDLFQTNSFDLVAGKVMRDKAAQFGIKPLTGARKVLSDLTNGWKESVLMSGSYPITNVVSGVASAALEGVNPGYTIRGLLENLPKAAAGEEIVSNRAAGLAKSLNIPLMTDRGGLLNEANAVHEITGQGMSVLQNLGPLKTAAIGGGIGGAGAAFQADGTNDAEAIVAGIGQGAALGAGAPYFSKYMQRLIRGAETQMRQDAWTVGVVGGVEKRLPDLMAKIDEALNIRNVLPGRANPQVNRTRALSGAQKDRARESIKTTLAGQAGLISPEDVQITLVRNGVHPSAAREVSQFWRTQVDEAHREGVGLVSKVHVNYEALTNLEQAMKTGVPFATWPIKMTPFFAEHILKRPSVALALIKFNEASDRVRREQGLTSRFDESVEVPFGSAVYSWLIGEPVRAFFNPYKSFLPASDAGRVTDRAMNSFAEGDPARGAYELFGAAGLSPHPMIDFAARQLWKDMPARGLIRQAEPIRGLGAIAGLNDGQGYDLNAAFTGVEELIKKARFGSAPPNLRDAAILRRIDEMSVAETGQSTKSGDRRVGDFVAAKETRSGEIWDKAARYVAKQRAAQSGVGFLFGALSPQAILTEEEAEIRAAQSNDDAEGQAAKDIETLRGALQDVIESGMGDDKAPPQTVADVANLVMDRQEAPGQQPISPTVIRAHMRSGTWESLARLLEMAYPPNEGAAGGYGASGMPDVVDTTSEMQVFTNISALASDAGMTPGEGERLGLVWEKYQKASYQGKRMMEKQTPTGGQLQKIKQLREDYLAAHPELSKYLNQANEGESIESYKNRTRREE